MQLIGAGRRGPEAIEIRSRRGCWICEGEARCPIEWITGWHLHPGELGVFFCGRCYQLVADDFAAMGFRSGLAAGGL